MPTKPANCTCRYPDVILRNGSGHDSHCPAYVPLGHQSPPPEQPFQHTHTETASYDEYKTADGKCRLTVTYQGAEFKELDVRIKVVEEGTEKVSWVQYQCTTLDEIDQFLTALHAAVAGIHKRKDPNGS